MMRILNCLFLIFFMQSLFSGESEFPLLQSVPLDPKSVETVRDFLCASVLYESRKYEEAEKLCLEALKKSPGEDFITLKLAQAYIHQKKNREAYDRLLDLTRRETPYSGEADILLASICLTEKRETEALGYLKHALNADRNNKGIYSALSQLYEELGMIEDARVTNLKALEQFPYETLFQMKVAQLYLMEKDYIKALPHWEKVYLSEASNIKVLLALALCYENQGNLKSAIDFYKKALRVDPLNTQAYTELIRLELGNKDFKSAFEDCNQLISLKEREVTGYLHFAWIALQSGDFVLGLERMKKAEEYFPEDGDVAYWMARLYAARQNVVLAEEYFKKAMTLQERNFEAAYYYGLFLHEQNKDREAIEILKRGLINNPRHGPSLNLAGYLILQAGLPVNEAISYIEKALNQEPENPAYLDSMGWALRKKGRFKESLLYLEEAVKRSDSPEIRRHLEVVNCLLKESYETKTSSEGKK